MDVPSIYTVAATQTREAVIVDFDLSSLVERVPPLLPDAILKRPKRQHSDVTEELEQLKAANARRMQVLSEPQAFKAQRSCAPVSTAEANAAKVRSYEEAMKALIAERENNKRRRYER